MSELAPNMLKGKNKMPSTTIDQIVARLMEATGSGHRKDLFVFLGIGDQAVRNAKKRGSVPASWLIRVSETTGYMVEWLLNGTEPKHKNDIKGFEKPFDNPPAAPMPTPFDNSGSAMAEAMAAAARVLASGTSYANALLLNIQHFDRAVADAKRIPLLEQKISELYNAIAFLQNEMATLKREYCQRLIDKEGVEDPDLPEICRPIAKAG